jgi:hypothetical protein
MKQALLIGCGNQKGERIVNGCIEAGYSVANIGSGASTIPTVNNIKIEWGALDIIKLHKILVKINHKVDFIFFNQNASSLSNIDFTQLKKTLDTWGLVKSWGHSYWLSCQLPYFLIKTLEKNLHHETIIGWMLSSYIDKNKEGVETHPDYSGNKYTNYMLMKNFNTKYQCFGIDPEFETSDKIQPLIKEICSGNKKCDGELF